MGDLKKIDKETAYIVGKNIVSFSADISVDRHTDVLNSLLFAQLASDKKYDQEKQTEEWYNRYREVLTTIGWVAQEFSFEDLKFSGNLFSLDKIILDLVKKERITLINKSLDALKKMEDNDDRLKLLGLGQNLYSDSNQITYRGNLQVSLISFSDDVVTMDNWSFIVNFSKNGTKLMLFGPDNSDFKLEYGSQRLSLDYQVFSQIRDQIAEKIKGRDNLVIEIYI